MDGVVDWLSEVPTKLVAGEASPEPVPPLPAEPSADRTSAPGAPVAPPRERPPYELWHRGPVPPEKPDGTHDFLTPENFLPGPVPPRKAEESAASDKLADHG